MAKPPKRKPQKKSPVVRTPTPTQPRPNSQAKTDSGKRPFNPKELDKSVIAIPLLKTLEDAKPEESHPVVIDLNLGHPSGLEGARQWVVEETMQVIAQIGITKEPKQGINLERSRLSHQYLFARLEAGVIRELVKRNISAQAIYRIWPDFKVRALITKSIQTVKADAAHASFSALGEGIVWAVLDSGIDAKHPHFKKHANLDIKRLAPLEHEDFTGTGSATEDALGHGTHVAGIIAGELNANDSAITRKQGIRAFTRSRDERGDTKVTALRLNSISGMAPRCMLVSFKVLDENGEGDVSSVLAAIAKIQEINGYGRRLVIHGVNMSIGYDFDPEWFACGQSPLCVEVNRLASTGVVVVVAAGNSGYGVAQSEQAGTVHAGLDMTIGDPGNAESAITVGATHRDSPHIFGVSYFSSKGPTGDGRSKPDLVAPGEKIISCAAGQLSAEYHAGEGDYIENSGTSMAAPHVSGVIAAFLSVRREFVGQSAKVKQVFLSTATDLRRERYFQGSGLVDLMRAIQSV